MYIYQKNYKFIQKIYYRVHFQKLNNKYGAQQKRHFS